MSHLNSIVRLQETLSELEVARERLDSIPDWMSELHEEHSHRLAEIEAEEEKKAEAERTQREAEADVADAREKLLKYQEQISQVTTQREYGALLTEIDTVKTEIREGEEAEVQALTDAEEAEAQVEQMRQDFEDLDRRYQAELEKWEAEKPEVESSAAELEKRAEEIRESVPRGLLSLFNRLRERTGGKAVAEVERLVLPKGNHMWHCQECNYNVRPQILVEIQNGEIHHCDSCKRILYWQPPEEDAAEAG